MRHKEPFIKDRDEFDKNHKEWGFRFVDREGIYSYYELRYGTLELRVFSKSNRIHISIDGKTFLGGKKQAEKYVEFMKDYIEWRYD